MRWYQKRYSMLCDTRNPSIWGFDLISQCFITAVVVMNSVSLLLICGGASRIGWEKSRKCNPTLLKLPFLIPLHLRLKTCEKIQQMRKYMRTTSDSTFERFSGKYFTVWCRKWAPKKKHLVWNADVKAQTWGPPIELDGVNKMFSKSQVIFHTALSTISPASNIMHIRDLLNNFV